MVNIESGWWLSTSKRGREIGAFSDVLINFAFGKDMFCTCLDATCGVNRNIILGHQNLYVNWLCPIQSLVMMTSVFLNISVEKIQGSIFRLISFNCVDLNDHCQCHSNLHLFLLKFVGLWEQIFKYGWRGRSYLILCYSVSSIVIFYVGILEYPEDFNFIVIILKMI